MRGVITILACALALVLAGCASTSPDPAWTKSGANSGDLAVDLYVCEHWSRNPREVQLPYLRDCMTAHGWREAGAELAD